MSLLEVRDVAIRFGGLQALADFTIDVNEWEIVGLIGPNGAGKTTAFNCITGVYRPDSGKVTYRGHDITRMPPHKKAAIGFGRTFQNVGMVKSSSALENLKTAQHAHIGYDVATGLLGLESARREERALLEKAEMILELLELQDVRHREVGGMSYGTLKLLELGCALATDPEILLLDEPSSGMGPDESDELAERLLVLRRELGLTMLLIEHHVPLVLGVCDHVYVLNFGQLLADGEPAYIQTHPEVVAAYLGGEAPEALAATHESDEQHALSLSLGESAASGPTSARRAAPVTKAPGAKKKSPGKKPAIRQAKKKASVVQALPVVPAEPIAPAEPQLRVPPAKKAATKATAKKAPTSARMGHAPLARKSATKAPATRAPAKKAAAMDPPAATDTPKPEDPPTTDLPVVVPAAGPGEGESA